MEHARRQPCLKYHPYPHRKEQLCSACPVVRMEAWFRVADICLTCVMALRILVDSEATILLNIKCKPMPSWPVVECARLWCGRQFLIVELDLDNVGSYWLWIVVHYSLQLFVWIPIGVLRLKVFSIHIMQFLVGLLPDPCSPLIVQVDLVPLETCC